MTYAAFLAAAILSLSYALAWFALRARAHPRRPDEEEREESDLYRRTRALPRPVEYRHRWYVERAQPSPARPATIEELTR